MKTYKIYSNPQGNNDAVKQGWSWPGFFFNIIWALVKKMWVLGIGLLVLFFILGAIEGAIEVSSGKEAALGMSALTSIINLVVAIVFGVNGNKWREKRLLSLGYDYKDTVNADNPEAGIATWMKERGKE